MANILAIKNLTYNGRVIGVIGQDLKTGEFKQYSFLDFNCVSDDSEHFQLVDLKTMPNCLLKTWLSKDDMRRFDSTELLPEEIKIFLKGFSDEHKKFNSFMGFSNDDLINNERSLETVYREEPSTNHLTAVKGNYLCPINTIDIQVDRIENGSSLRPAEMELIKNVLLHELGHCKVSNFTVDFKNLVLKSRVGFHVSNFKLNPICIVGKDLIFAPKLLPQKSHFIALEEAFNEYECTFIKSDYSYSYPEYGQILNRLSDGTLLEARHFHDSDEYFRVLTRIIPDKNLARILLSYMYKSLNETEEINAGKAFTILKKYERAKSKHQ